MSAILDRGFSTIVLFLFIRLSLDPTTTDRAISEKWITRAKSLQSREATVLKHRNNFMKYFLGIIRQTISETGQSPGCCTWGVSTRRRPETYPIRVFVFRKYFWFFLFPFAETRTRSFRQANGSAQTASVPVPLDAGQTHLCGYTTFAQPRGHGIHGRSRKTRTRLGVPQRRQNQMMPGILIRLC